MLCSPPEPSDVMARVFLVHAATDEPVVDLFVTLILQGGLGVPVGDISRNHLPEPVPAGFDFADHVRDEVESAEAVLFMLSRSFVRRPSCLAELGAAWVLAPRRFPIAVQPLDDSGLESIWAGHAIRRIGDEGDLKTLGGELADALGIDLGGSRWNGTLRAFLDQLPEALEALPQEPAGPGTSAGAAPRARTELDEFTALVAQARDALGGLPSVVQVSLYKMTRGDLLKPGARGDYSADFTWDDVEKEIEQKRLALIDSEGGVKPNLGKPAVRKAAEALEALTQWLRSASRGFRRAYEERHRHEPAVTSRAFWEAHLRRRD